MSERSHNPVFSEAVSAPSERNIVRLASLAKETLDREDIQPEKTDQSRELTKNDLPQGDAALKEFIDPGTGRLTYEYSEVRRDDPVKKHIYRWAEGDTKITILLGSATDAEAEPTFDRQSFAIDDTFAHLRGRLNQLKTPV